MIVWIVLASDRKLFVCNSDTDALGGYQALSIVGVKQECRELLAAKT